MGIGKNINCLFSFLHIYFPNIFYNKHILPVKGENCLKGLGSIVNQKEGTGKKE